MVEKCGCGAGDVGCRRWRGPAAGQAFPTKTVRLILPFPPGGPSDILGRALAQKLTEQMGQQVIADNRPGAGGNLGLELTAKAPPDGYTMVLSLAADLDQPVALLEAQLRSAEGPRADLAGRANPERRARASFGAGEKPEGAGAGRAREPRQAQLRLRRRRHDDAPRARAFHEHDQDEDGARAVQRLGSRADRPDQRPGRRAHHGGAGGAGAGRRPARRARSR